MNTSLFVTLQNLYQGADTWAECVLGAAILSGPRYFLKASLCPLNAMMGLVCIVSPEVVSVSRRCWFVPQPRKRLNVTLRRVR